MIVWTLMTRINYQNMPRPKSRTEISRSTLIRIKDEIEKRYCEVHGFSNISDAQGQMLDTKFRETVLGTHWHKITSLNNLYLRKYLYDELNKGLDRYFVTKPFRDGIKKYLGVNLIGTPEEPNTEYEYGESKIEQFSNLKLTYYYYEEKSDQPGISIGQMHFKKSGQVSIIDRLPESNQLIQYEGEVQLISNGHLLLMNLKTKDFSERDLHVLLHVSNYGKLPEVMSGQYHNIDHKNTIVSGTLIALINPPTGRIDFDPEFFEKDSDLYREEIPATIREYLSQKENNRIKVPATFFSLLQLQEWLRGKRNSSFVSLEKTKLKAFISAPATSLGSVEEYREFKKGIQKVSEALDKYCSITAFSAILKFDSFKEYRFNNVLLNEVVQNLETSDLFILILPNLTKKRTSSSFIEFGYALKRKLRMAIFVHDSIGKDQLPNLLSGAMRGGYKGIMEHDFENLDDILIAIEKYGRSIFKTFD
ncbi:MAG: hypothetical protein Roseis2KO_47530 [Roseivirga sp.]